MTRSDAFTDKSGSAADDRSLVLLPAPARLEFMGGEFPLALTAMIVLSPSCPRGADVYAKMLKEDIALWAGLDLPLTRGGARSGDIRLAVEDMGAAGGSGAAAPPENGASSSPEAYRIVISGDGVLLAGHSLAALGWAVQTLRQILRQRAGLLPCLRIEDAPKLPHRGFFHDVTRGRIQSLANLKRLADKLSYYKMNQLQLNIEHTYLFRDLTEMWRDEDPLSSEDILELDRYCGERGVELVPAMATFGHLYKLLRTRSFEELCELPGSTKDRFSFSDRMKHHTINVSHPKAMTLIRSMVEEYMQLFQTDRFNICADETFDLGKGRSREVAEKRGAAELYVDHVSELMRFLIERGRKPMFWGDIINDHPELYGRLPEGVVCLNWGYSPTVADDKIRALRDAGAVQYLCPGVQGWNRWINHLPNAYANIRRMAGYAEEYGAEGLLTTDWGDFGHIAHPAFSVPGLIYGAVFAWDPDGADREELNRQISVLEYGDESGAFLSLWEKIPETVCFGWRRVVLLKENLEKAEDVPDDGQLPRREKEDICRKYLRREDLERTEECESMLDGLIRDLYEAVRRLYPSVRELAAHMRMALDMIRVWNRVGSYLLEALDGGSLPGERFGGARAIRLASELEICVHQYQKLWRRGSREAGLSDITDVFCWYADRLRDMAGTDGAAGNGERV